MSMKRASRRERSPATTLRALDSQPLCRRPRHTPSTSQSFLNRRAAVLISCGRRQLVTRALPCQLSRPPVSARLSALKLLSSNMPPVCAHASKAERIAARTSASCSEERPPPASRYTGSFAGAAPPASEKGENWKDPG
eukprot:5069969-Pleurochrysis_carterae.AAC.1